jgi:hypothetical protein
MIARHGGGSPAASNRRTGCTFRRFLRSSSTEIYTKASALT